MLIKRPDVTLPSGITPRKLFEQRDLCFTAFDTARMRMLHSKGLGDRAFYCASGSVR